MSRWFDKAAEQIEKDLESGCISKEEYQEQMRDLRRELRDEARENADQAYEDTMNHW
jgi:hypothetical protein